MKESWSLPEVNRTALTTTAPNLETFKEGKDFDRHQEMNARGTAAI